jgi:hypothetical protein
MVVPNGEERLIAFTATAYPPTVTEVVAGVVYHLMGYGCCTHHHVASDLL